MVDFVGVRVTGIKETFDYFEMLAKDQFPFALSKACNDTAFLIRDAEMDKMREVFDRPKEQTVRNIRVFKGNKSRPGATIAFAQIYDGDEYMVAEVEGGQRSMKRSEQAFGHYYVPGVGARLDQYGNIVPGQITQILSCLQMMKENGYSANRRNKAHRSGTQYFMLQQKTNGLVPGIYQRVDAGELAGRVGRYMAARALIKKNRVKGQMKELDQKTRSLLMRGVIPVLIFVNRPPAYKARFPFFDVVNQVTNANWSQVMGDAVDFAIKTAR